VTLAGLAYCWGRNINGQLGTGGGYAEPPAPVQALGLLFTDITAGVLHTCAVTTAGSVYCWGDTNFGASGPAGGPIPGRVLAGDAVASGTCHSCGRGTTRWFCWGRNDSWQLGTGDGTDLGDGRVDNPARVTGQP
jgi:alpha-tubulin suppressor-like RCC1 family protein